MNLRILDIHGAKITKNETPLAHFAWLFYTQTVYQKSEGRFFDQVARDGKSVLTHLWPLGQKNSPQIFDRRSGCKIIKQNVLGGLIFSDFSTMYI